MKSPWTRWNGNRSGRIHRCNHDWVVRNDNRFRGYCFKLFNGLAGVLRSAIAVRIRTTGFLRSADRQKIPSSRTQNGFTCTTQRYLMPMVFQGKPSTTAYFLTESQPGGRKKQLVLGSRMPPTECRTHARRIPPSRSRGWTQV